MNNSIEAAKETTIPIVEINSETVNLRESIAKEEIQKATDNLNNVLLELYYKYGCMCEVVWHKGYIKSEAFLEVNLITTPDKFNWGKQFSNH